MLLSQASSDSTTDKFSCWVALYKWSGGIELNMWISAGFPELQPRMRGWVLASIDGKTTGIVPLNYIKFLGRRPGRRSTQPPAAPPQQTTLQNNLPAFESAFSGPGGSGDGAVPSFETDNIEGLWEGVFTQKNHHDTLDDTQNLTGFTRKSKWCYHIGRSSCSPNSINKWPVYTSDALGKWCLMGKWNLI